MSNLRICVVIPARLQSTRLPRKLLLPVSGRSIIHHTYRAAVAADVGAVLVATADSEIADEVTEFGAKVAWTSPDAASGTDRVAEVAVSHPEVEIFVNLQGDEPEMPFEYVQRVVQVLKNDPESEVATLAAPFGLDAPQCHDPSSVKVVVGHHGRALYFSRSMIPFIREPSESNSDCPPFLQHLGLYAYRRNFLLNIERIPPSRLEQMERLEQLRFLEAGYQIAVGTVPHATRGIDTREDYQALCKRWTLVGTDRKDLRELQEPIRKAQSAIEKCQ